MSSLIVEISKITEIKPHPNADLLEQVVIKGWNTIVPKNQYQVEDLVVYVPPDSILSLELSDKLGVSKYLAKGRVKAAKLRGEVSFGLVFKPEIVGIVDYQEGNNVAEQLNIIKWEPPLDLRAKGGNAEKQHPLFIRYTDIENYRNFPDVLQEGEEVVISEKLHGCLIFDTLILTNNGLVKIGDIVENKLNVNVLSYNIKKNQLEFDKIINYLSHDNNLQWFEIETEDGKKIKITENHYVFLPKLNCYRQVKELEENDEVFIV